MFYDSRESTDFLTRLYSRLEARQGDVSGIDAIGEAAGSQFPRREAGKNKGRERQPWQQMVGAIAAVFIVALLVSSLVFVFNRTRQASSIGSHPNMQTSATIASLHMLDEQSGWALSDKDLI